MSVNVMPRITPIWERVILDSNIEDSNLYTLFEEFCFCNNFDSDAAFELCKKLFLFDADGKPVCSKPWSKDIIWIYQPENSLHSSGVDDYSAKIYLSVRAEILLQTLLDILECAPFQEEN